MKKLKIFMIICLIILLIPVIINAIVIFSVNKQIKKVDEIKDIYDIGMVLGCGIKNNEPSLMLRDRLDKGVELYQKGIIKSILITGDHKENYSEVNVMEKYLKENNIPDNDIIKDYQGYNTSLSIKNYNANYKDKSLIVITQKYHIYRSLYIANYYNLNGIGTIALNKRYKGQFIRDIREVLARCKDFLQFLN